MNWTIQELLKDLEPDPNSYDEFHDGVDALIDVDPIKLGRRYRVALRCLRMYQNLECDIAYHESCVLRGHTDHAEGTLKP